MELRDCFVEEFEQFHIATLPKITDVRDIIVQRVSDKYKLERDYVTRQFDVLFKQQICHAV